MRFNKQSLFRLLSYVVPLFLAGLVVVSEHHLELTWGYLHGCVTKSVFIVLVLLEWILSVRRRFPQKQMRSNVTVFAALFILLELLSTVKFCMVTYGGTAARLLWYAYYFPLVFGPLFMFYAALCFGKPDDFQISKKWYWLMLPAFLLSVGVLCNDWHQLAFRFPNGMATWEADYTHGVLYFLASGWAVLGMLSVIWLMIRSTYNRRLMKALWIPGMVLVLMGIYPLLYAYPGRNVFVLQRIFEMNDFICVSCVVLWESLVIARIIVSNNDYPAIFAVSSLRAGLADRTFQVRQTSASGVRPKPEEIEKAKNGELLLPDGDTLLKVRAVQGGWFYWTEDISELRRLNEELEDTAGYLTEENDLMRLSAELDAGQKRTAAQTKLVDSVTESLRPQMNQLGAWVQNLPEDEQEFRASLKKAAVLLAYAKRRGNLLMQADEHPVLNGEELRLCFEESARALRQAGVPCLVTVDTQIRISAQSAASLYEAFEIVLEHVLPVLNEMEITLEKPNGDSLTLHLTALTQTAVLSDETFAAVRRTLAAAKPGDALLRTHIVQNPMGSEAMDAWL